VAKTFYGWTIIADASMMRGGRVRLVASKRGKLPIFVEGRVGVSTDIIHARLEVEVLAQEVRDAEGENKKKFVKLYDEATLRNNINNRTRSIERAMRSEFDLPA
jgi:uncharacterized protein YggE